MFSERVLRCLLGYSPGPKCLPKLKTVVDPSSILVLEAGICTNKIAVHDGYRIKERRGYQGLAEEKNVWRRGWFLAVGLDWVSVSR